MPINSTQFQPAEAAVQALLFSKNHCLERSKAIPAISLRKPFCSTQVCVCYLYYPAVRGAVTWPFTVPILPSFWGSLPFDTSSDQ